jgi:hypothetical protein
MVLCDDAFIARMNAEWRGVAGPTDVLSFPMEDDDDIKPAPGGPPRMLGDLFISLDTAQRQAAERGCACACTCGTSIVLWCCTARCSWYAHLSGRAARGFAPAVWQRLCSKAVTCMHNTRHIP